MPLGVIGGVTALIAEEFEDVVDVAGVFGGSIGCRRRRWSSSSPGGGSNEPDSAEDVDAVEVPDDPAHDVSYGNLCPQRWMRLLLTQM